MYGVNFGFCVLFPVESTTDVPGPSGVQPQPDAPGPSGLGPSGLGPSGRKSAAERGKGRQLSMYVIFHRVLHFTLIIPLGEEKLDMVIHSHSATPQPRSRLRTTPYRWISLTTRWHHCGSSAATQSSTHACRHQSSRQLRHHFSQCSCSSRLCLSRLNSLSLSLSDLSCLCRLSQSDLCLSMVLAPVQDWTPSPVTTSMSEKPAECVSLALNYFFGKTDMAGNTTGTLEWSHINRIRDIALKKFALRRSDADREPL